MIELINLEPRLSLAEERMREDINASMTTDNFAESEDPDKKLRIPQSTLVLKRVSGRIKSTNCRMLLISSRMPKMFKDPDISNSSISGFVPGEPSVFAGFFASCFAALATTFLLRGNFEISPGHV